MADSRHYTEKEAEEILRLAAQQESDRIPRERLIQMGEELGLSADQVVRAESEFLAKTDSNVERQKFESYVLRQLWSHVATYVAVNGGLILLDVVPDGRIDWAYWPLVGWGIGLVCHIVSVFWSSSDAETKAFEEWKVANKPFPLTSSHREILDEIARRHPQQMLMAIKVFRDQTGVGLREAKLAVEQYETVHPGTFLPWPR